MQVLPSQKLFSLPALQLRAFIREHETFTYREFAEAFKLSAKTAKELLADMVAARYLEAPAQVKGLYKRDIEGRRLHNALAVNKISRAQAEALLADLLDRVAELANNDVFLFEVDELWVFGSYVKNAALLSDIDLCLSYRYKARLGPYEKNLRRVLRAAEKAGRSTTFWNAPSRHGRDKAARFLKSRRRHLSLMTLSALHLEGAHDAQCLYKALPQPTLPGGEPWA